MQTCPLPGLINEAGLCVTPSLREEEMSNDFAFSPLLAAPASPVPGCRQGRATLKASQCLPAPHDWEDWWRCSHLPPTRHFFKAFLVQDVGLGFSSWGHVGKHPYAAALAPRVLGCDNGEGAVRWCWPAEGFRAQFPIAVSPFYEVFSYFCLQRHCWLMREGRKSLGEAFGY